MNIGAGVPRLNTSLLVLLSVLAGSLVTYLALTHRTQIERLYPVSARVNPLGSKLDENCRQYAEEHRKQLGLKTDFDQVSDFYSQKLDTCVEALSSSIQNSFLVKDISGGFIKPSLEGFGDYGQALFDCDSSGVDHAILEKVKEHHGYVWNLPYAQYMDDFNGGPPRTDKSAEKWYTRKNCEEYFQKELKELR